MKLQASAVYPGLRRRPFIASAYVKGGNSTSPKRLIALLRADVFKPKLQVRILTQVSSDELNPGSLPMQRTWKGPGFVQRSAANLAASSSS
jgi:hypothetical protein